MLWVENIVLLNYSFRRDSCENIMTRFSHLFLNELKNYMLITFFKKRYHSRFCFLFMFIFIIFIIFKMILRDLRIYPRGVSSGMFNHLARRRLLKNCINFFFLSITKVFILQRKYDMSRRLYKPETNVFFNYFYLCNLIFDNWLWLSFHFLGKLNVH